jgi:hypothetical protein
LQQAISHLPSLHFTGSQAAVLVPPICAHVDAVGHFAQFADTSEAAFLTSCVLFCALTNRTTTKASTTKPDKPIITFFIFQIFIKFYLTKNSQIHPANGL